VTAQQNFPDGGSDGRLGLILKSLAFAADKHRNQRRKGETAVPYVNHVIALVNVLHNEAGVTEPLVLCAAILHDTLEDTDTTADEIATNFGAEVREVVAEVSDDKRLPKGERKRLQIEHAPHLSEPAKLVKLSDKICNLRDIIAAPPAGWPLARKQEYFDWAKAVVAGLRGTNAILERLFDEVYALRPIEDQQLQDHAH
jgi:GTP diphosphokinase / guanosine-3',5'-bis(diphosphate) 3'-diphosphatase